MTRDILELRNGIQTAVAITMQLGIPVSRGATILKIIIISI